MEILSLGEWTLTINPELVSVIVPLLIGGGILFAIFFGLVLYTFIKIWREASRDIGFGRFR